jgi:uncharacterized protein
MSKLKSGDRTPVPRQPRYGPSGPKIFQKLNLKEEQMTPTLFGMRPPVDGLTVVGEASRDAPPEIIELSFELHSVGLSAAIALQENAAKATHIGQAVATIGNAQTDVKTGGVEVLPILQLPNPPLPFLPAAFGVPGANAPMVPALSENPNLIGYRAVSSIKVAVRDVNRVGDIVEIVTRAGAVPTGSMRFLLQDEATVENTLLEEAVRRAREKATVLAAAVGKSTGNPVSISEEFTTYQPQQFYGNGRHNPFLMAPGGSNVRLPFIPGQLTFCARVSVVYQFQ